MVLVNVKLDFIESSRGKRSLIRNIFTCGVIFYVVLLGRWRLYCEDRPILDFYATTATYIRCTCVQE